MKHSARLADLLQSTFGLDRARVTCLTALVIALFRVKTVNLAQLATAFPGTAEIGACNASASTSNSSSRAWPHIVSCSLFYPTPPTP
jgi:hypothetical protein